MFGLTVDDELVDWVETGVEVVFGVDTEADVAFGTLVDVGVLTFACCVLAGFDAAVLAAGFELLTGIAFEAVVVLLA